jgi:hypothetical protein
MNFKRSCALFVALSTSSVFAQGAPKGASDIRKDFSFDSYRLLRAPEGLPKPVERWEVAKPDSLPTLKLPLVEVTRKKPEDNPCPSASLREYMARKKNHELTLTIKPLRH